MSLFPALLLILRSLGYKEKENVTFMGMISTKIPLLVEANNTWDFASVTLESPINQASTLNYAIQASRCCAGHHGLIWSCGHAPRRLGKHLSVYLISLLEISILTFPLRSSVWTGARCISDRALLLRTWPSRGILVEMLQGFCRSARRWGAKLGGAWCWANWIILLWTRQTRRVL